MKPVNVSIILTRDDIKCASDIRPIPGKHEQTWTQG